MKEKNRKSIQIIGQNENELLVNAYFERFWTCWTTG